MDHQPENRLSPSSETMVHPDPSNDGQHGTQNQHPTTSDPAIGSHFTIKTTLPPLRHSYIGDEDSDGGGFDKKTVLFIITVAVLCFILLVVCIVFLWRVLGPPGWLPERLRQLGMSDPSSRSYKAGDLSDPEQQLRYHLQQLEASQASSGRKPSNMSYSIASNRNGSVIAIANTSIASRQAAQAVQQAYEDEEEDTELDEDGKAKLPCLNCRLIQMGSSISYGDNSCPQCGRDTFGQ